jgi:hypothetical protein
MMTRAHRTILLTVAALVGCSHEPRPLTEGATWVSREVPAALRSSVSRYERAETFGAKNDPHGWHLGIRTTLRDDAPVDAGCSVTEWVAGTWSVKGETLTITTPDAGSGSREVHDCPDGSMPRTVPRSSSFDRESSTFVLDGHTLQVARRFGEAPRDPVVLTRVN